MKVACSTQCGFQCEFDFQATKTLFWATSILQTLTGMLSCAAAVNVDLISIFFMSFNAILVAELSDRVKEIFQSAKVGKEKHQEMVECVNLHL